MIPFNGIPNNLRVPLFYAEVDNSRANSGQTTDRALIIAQITESGAATPNVPVICQGEADAITQGGKGSVLALMTKAYKVADGFGEVWYLPLSDAEGALAASGKIKINSAPTANGVISLYIGGVLISQPALYTQTTSDIATALCKALNNTANLPVIATVESDTVTVTAINKGPLGNDIDLRLNYRGLLGGESTPEGMEIVLTAMIGGATPPSLTEALANLGDTEFDYIVMPYNDSGSLDALKTFLDGVNGRWSWSKQLFGGCFVARSGTLGSLTTFGVSRNDEHGSVMGVCNSPTPSWIWACAVAGAAASSLRIDPARPLQTLTIPGVLAPPKESQFDISDRNVLLWSGISTFTVAQDGTVAIDNLITTYQKNKFNQPDDSYLQVETLYTLAYVLRQLKIVITSKFPRMKLADSGTAYALGSAIVTPKTIRGELIARYKALEYDGYVQGSDIFAEELIVERNSKNPNRLDVLWPGILINQLRILALLAQFRLSTGG